jgi:hypothetical protein
MKKRIMPAMAAMALVAFAIPATASATQTHFFDTVDPNIFPFSVTFTGTMTPFILTIAKTESIHCPQTTLTVRIDGPTMGEVTGFDTTTECKTTSADPNKNGLIVHAHKVGTWTVQPGSTTDRINITGFHINGTVTIGGVVTAEHTIKGGTVIAAIPSGQKEAIKTVSLSGEGVGIQWGMPPGGGILTGSFPEGHLTSNGTLGLRAP